MIIYISRIKLALYVYMKSFGEQLCPKQLAVHPFPRSVYILVDLNLARALLVSEQSLFIAISVQFLSSSFCSIYNDIYDTTTVLFYYNFIIRLNRGRVE